jgi:hypothetical protein
MSVAKLIDECIDHGKRGTGKGYAQRSVKGKMRYMHRLALAERLGVDEETMEGVARHRCDNTRCINGNHLELGTYQDNTDDMFERGRQNPPRGERSHTAMLTAEQVMAIRASSQSNKAQAKAYGVSTTCISDVRTRKTWSHI